MWRDLRLAYRNLFRDKAFSLVAIGLMALAVGAGATVFTFVDSVLLQPLPYGQPERLVTVLEQDLRRGRGRQPTSPANYLDWRSENLVLEDLAAAHPWSPVLKGDGRPRQVQALRATPNLFQVLRVAAAQGEVFSPETAGQDPRVVVLGHEIWQREFGADPGVVGSTLNLDDEEFRVVGVMPQGFHFPPFWAVEADLWSPRIFTPEEAAQRSARFLRTFGRLRDSVSLGQARSHMESLGARLLEAYPRENENTAIDLEALPEPVVSGVRPALAALSGAVGALMLIAFANLGGLYLARGMRQARASSVRLALGATRWRLYRLWIAETTWLSAAGASAGCLAANWAIGLMLRMGPEDFPRRVEIGFDWRAALFAFLASFLAGALFASAPAIQALTSDLTSRLKKRGAQAGSPSGRRRLPARSLLVVGQLALCLCLLCVAGLALTGFSNLLNIDPGFNRQGILSMQVSLAGSSNADAQRQVALFEEIQRQAEALPGVDRASLINHLPIGGDIWGISLSRVGGERASASVRTVLSGYFDAMGIPILRGRDFSPGLDAGSPLEVMISQPLAMRLWGSLDVIGQRIKQGRMESDNPWMTVVGVVRGVRQWDLTDPVRAEVFFPYAQNPFSWYLSSTLVLRSQDQVPGLARTVMERIWQEDPDLAISQVRDVSQILSDSVRQPRLQTVLLSGFSAAALLLAVVGLYGLVAYSVAQRSRETGIRIALGARRQDISRLIVGEGLRLSLLGTGLGLAMALGVARWIGNQFFEVGWLDPLSLSAASSLLVATALLAAWLPARRAARADPIAALRQD